MSYKVKYHLPSIPKDLAALSQEAQKRIAPHIDALKEDPRPAGAKALQGLKGLYRIRVGAYRIAYFVNDENRLVYLTAVGKRDDIYQKAAARYKQTRREAFP